MTYSYYPGCTLSTKARELDRCGRLSAAALGVELVSRPIATVENGYVRHHSENLARELILLHAERSVRIAGEDFRKDSYRLERKQ